MARTESPQDLTITPRDRRFGRGARTEHWWMGGDAGDDPLADQGGEGRLEPGGRAEMVEQVGVGLADLGRHGLQGDRLRALLDQQPAGRFERRRAALLRAQTFTNY